MAPVPEPLADRAADAPDAGAAPGARSPAEGGAAAAAKLPQPSMSWRAVAYAVLLVVAVGAAVLAWRTNQRAEALEAELARRAQENAQSAQAAQEARVLARQADTAARDMAAKLALLDARVAETAMQRSQFEDLLQSLARSRDENVLADMEAALRVAQQQSAITGSAEPLLQMLRQADERLARYGQPRLERVRRAVAQDLERTRAAGIVDVSTLAIRLDDVVRQVGELPLLLVPPQVAAGRRGGAPGADAATTAGAGRGASGAAAMLASPAGAGAGSAAGTSVTSATSAPSAPSAGVVTRTGPPGSPLETLRHSWNRFAAHVWAETRALVRITPIAAPEAMLLAPEQAWYLRENLKLRLLNARLALLSRQFDTAQSDLRDAQATVERYFDRSARRTTLAIEALRQVAAQARTVAVPRPDATLAAIATAAAGR